MQDAQRLVVDEAGQLAPYHKCLHCRQEASAETYYCDGYETCGWGSELENYCVKCKPVLEAHEATCESRKAIIARDELAAQADAAREESVNRNAQFLTGLMNAKTPEEVAAAAAAAAAARFRV
jgi:hypothetical protein